MKIWEKMMRIGHFFGCHQMPERSFFVGGYQFPVCARCTGVYFGALLSIFLFFRIKPNILICISGCIIMFLDWWLQHRMILFSTNWRRLMTGSFAGYGLMSIELCIIDFILQKKYQQELQMIHYETGSNMTPVSTGTSTSSTIQSVQTGDTARPFLWMVLCIGSVGAIAVLMKRKYSEK